MASKGALVVRFIGDTKDFDGANRRVQGSFGKIGKIATAGLAVAGAAAIKLGVDSVKAASTLEESVNAVRVSYGKAADGILKLGDNSAKSLGLSRSELNSTAVQFSSFSKTIAGKGGNVVKAFHTIAGRATDFASVMNLDVSDALERFQSGLAGETEPLRKFGIDLSAVKVESFAYAKGIAKTGEALTEGQKVQARYGLLMQQTAEVQGDFANTSDSLANRQRILAARFEDVKAKLGTLLLPAVSEFFGLVADKGIPALDRLAGWLKKNQDEIASMGGATKDALLPPLKLLAGLASDVAGFLADLPAPVKSFGIQAVIAAVVVTKLNAALVASKVAVGGFIGGIRTAETRTAALGKAARVAAGVGGLLLLVDGLQRAESATTKTGKALGAFETIAGGAAVGFSVGGPWGAAAGTLAGVGKATWDLTEAMNHGIRAYGRAVPAAQDFADSLNEVSGAATRATRTQILEAAAAQGILAPLRALDIANRDLIGAVLGNEGATKRLNKAMLANLDALQPGEYATLTQFLRKNTNALALQGRETRNNYRDTTLYKKALKGLPPEVRVKVKQLGAEASVGELRRLRKQYNLTPKQVRTIIRATETDATIRKVKGVWRILQDVKKVKGDLTPFERDILRNLGNVEGKVRSGTGSLKKLLQGSGRVRADTGPFTGSISDAIGKGKTLASSGAHGIGLSLKSGVLRGVSGISALLSGEVAAAVNAAIAAGKRAAKSKSPSKRMMALGKDLVDGLVLAMRAGKGKAAQAGKNLIDEAVKAVGKNKVRLTSTGAAIMNGLINGLRKGEIPLKRALEKVAALVKSHGAKIKALQSKRAEVVSGFGGFASSAFGATFSDTQGNDLAPTVASLIDYQRQQAAKAAALKVAVGKLVGMGLSKDLIRQLSSQGESGFAQIMALSGGSQLDIKTLSSLNAQTQRDLTGAGGIAGDALYGEDIRQAQRDKRLAEEIAKALHRLDRKTKDDRVIVLELDGKVLHSSLLKRKRTTSKNLGLS